MTWRIPSLRRMAMFLSIALLSACDLTDKPQRTMPLSDKGLFSASLSEHYALIGDLAGYAELWQLKPKALLHKWQHTDDSQGIIAVDISSNEEYAVTAEKNSIAWWRIADGLLLSVWSLPDIYSVSISPDGQFALVGLADKAIYLSLSQGLTRYAFEHEDIVLATDLSDSGRYALTGSEDKSAKLWNLQDGSLKYRWQHDNKLSAVAISHHDNYALTNAALTQTRLWKITNGEVVKTLGPDRTTLSSIAFSSQDKFVLLGHISQRIELWRTATGELQQFWRAKKKDAWRPTAATIVALAFTSHDKTFHSLATNGYLQRWSVK